MSHRGPMSQLESPGTQHRASEATSGACRSILLVEDDPLIRESLQDALELEGYRIVAASNGREALDKLPSMSRPCLILLDLMMPVMNGWEFADALQGDLELAEIPIVVLTAFGQELQRQKIATRGVIPKPVDLDRLFRLVEGFCG
jgi:CheY-like chemotaxis protein